MPDSKHDYENDIRHLMNTLSSEEGEKKTETSEHHEKEQVRLSTPPVATDTADIPLVLGREPSHSSDATRVERMVDHVDIIIPTEDMLKRSNGGQRMEGDRTAVDDESFIQHYMHTQRVLRDGRISLKYHESFLGRQMIFSGDTIPQMLQKALFWIVLAVVSVSLCFGVYVLGIEPLIAVRQDQQLSAAYDEQAEGVVGKEETEYPRGMLASFRKLHDINKQVFGYIQYKDTADGFLNIDAPIAFPGDNTTYVNRSFHGKLSLDGALYVDERCGLPTSSLTVIYGKNPMSGRMFASLNTLVGSVNNARAASRFTFSTLYEKAEYRVFAVVLTDEAATGEFYFDSSRTEFASDAEFEVHMEAAMARSLFDYGVSVTADDDVVVLVTDASPSVAKMGKARIAVFARRVRENDSAPLIVKNDDVIMPLAWYEAQGLPPHEHYSTTTTNLTTTTTTSPSDTTTVPSDGATTTTAPSDSTATTTVPTDTPSAVSNTVGDDGVVDLG